MAIRTYRPYTKSRRAMSNSTFEDITKATPEKSLLATKKHTGGRNNQGVITCRHIGGGNKNRYRIIDFRRRKDGIPATVAAIEYDPNRNAYIALLNYADGEKRYIIQPNGLKVGELVTKSSPVKPPISRSATRSNYRTSQKVPSSTTLNSSQAKALRCAVPLALPPRSSAPKATMSSSVSLLAKSASS